MQWEYKQAANLVLEYARTHTIIDGTPSEKAVLSDNFRKKFGPDALKSLSDDNLLMTFFPAANKNKGSLCYDLRYNRKLAAVFGSIRDDIDDDLAVSSAKEKDNRVKATFLSKAKKRQLSTSIRDNLVKGSEIIKSSVLDSVEAYEKLEDELTSLMGDIATHAWVCKYYRILFPEQFVGWYAPETLMHFLLGFGIRPSGKYYGMNGQLALIRKNSGDKAPLFENISYAMFGKTMRQFYRLDCPGVSKQSIKEWKRKGIVGIDGKEAGNLSNYLENVGIFSIDKLSNYLTKCYKNNKEKASQKAEELKAFYETSPSSVIVVTNGHQLIAFIDNLSCYFHGITFDHLKNGDWHLVFDKSDRLPAYEGSNTSCYEIKNTDNILYLYKKYYQYLGVNYPSASADIMPDPKDTMQNTGYHSDFERNRIFFGAPGTGKSYTLNQEKDYLPGVDYERVTFHPDYSYASFVGTYKPVPSRDSDDKDAITYAYVPGPFMRTYVKAVKSSRTDTPKPFLLIIEEINRANVAAVFGDVFQLLDRNDDGRSMYPIQASEDIRKYLAHELGGDPDDYPEICIPGNMFIWATMNSADQGVFPMDTAFKRRWDFTYLGIDDSEAGIAGKTVVLGQGEYLRLVEWNALRKAINNELLTYRLNEDKLMGPYFLSGRILPEGKEFDPDAFARVFKNKVIMYLFEDAARQKRSTLFGGCADESRNQYSKICREFDVKGVHIFCDRISSQFAAAPGDTVPEGDAE